MNQPTAWTARTVAEALDLLAAVEQRIQSGMKAAYPGNPATRLRAGKDTPFNLRITFDTSELDRIADERSIFDEQVKDGAE